MMKAKVAFIYFNLIDRINYTNLLKLYSIAEYNKSTKRYDTINYKTQKYLAELLGITASSVQVLLTDNRYNEYFNVDKNNKIITLNNDFSNINNRPFVLLTASQLNYLIENEAVSSNRDLFIKYFLYIKHYQDKEGSNRLDFTANQFLQHIGYSNKSNNTKDLLGKFNKILTASGYLDIQVKHDNRGYQRNYYQFIYE